jgi:hypothetical protein
LPRYLGGLSITAASSLRLYQPLRRGAKVVPAMGCSGLLKSLVKTTSPNERVVGGDPAPDLPPTIGTIRCAPGGRGYPTPPQNRSGDRVENTASPTLIARKKFEQDRGPAGKKFWYGAPSRLYGHWRFLQFIPPPRRNDDLLSG